VKAPYPGTLGRWPARQEAHVAELYRAGGHTTAELAELFGVARSTIYRALQRNPPAAAELAEM